MSPLEPASSLLPPLEPEFDALELHVLPRTQDGYPIISRSSRLGEAHGLSRLDPTAEWLEDVVALLQKGYLEAEQFEQFGALLLLGEPQLGIHGLLPQEIRDHYQACMGATPSDGRRGLELRLRLEPPELAAVPFEYLFDPQRKVFLATSPHFPLSRAVSAILPEPNVSSSLPLKGLLLAPQGQDPLLEEEINALLNVSQSFPRQLEWKVFRDTHDLRTLEALLTAWPPDILHFAGHGRWLDSSLSLETGKGQHLSERDFADLLLWPSSVRLCVINACLSGRLPMNQPQGGLAQRLLLRDCPAVVVVQQRITHEGALRFSSALYRALLGGPVPGHLGVATNMARATLLRQSSASPAEFGAPVLYLRSQSAWLFRAPNGSPTPPMPRIVPSQRETSPPPSPDSVGEAPQRPSASSEAISPAIASSTRHPARWLALAALLLVLWTLRGLEVLSPLELYRYHAFTSLVAPEASFTHVLGVDLSQKVEPWPWRRSTLATLISRLLLQGQAAQIVLDVRLIDAPTRLEDLASFEDGNQRLRDAITVSLEGEQHEQANAPDARGHAVVLALDGSLTAPTGGGPYTFKEGIPLPHVLQGLEAGFPVLMTEGPRGTLALRAPLAALGSHSDTPFVFSLAALAASRGRPPVIRQGASPALLVHDVWIRTNERFEVELPKLEETDLPVLEAAALLDAASSPLALVRDKILILGTFSDKVSDRVATPWGYRSGASLQAALISALVSGQCIRRAPPGLELLSQCLLTGLLGALVWIGKTSRRQLMTVLLLVPLLIVGELLMLHILHLRLTLPVLEAGLLGMLASLRFFLARERS